jgi:hypothetical protein
MKTLVRTCLLLFLLLCCRKCWSELINSGAGTKNHKPALPADEPYLLKNQARQTRPLFNTKSVTRDGMGACEPKVYNGNAYAIYMRQGDERVMVAKVPLNGSATVTLPLVTGKDTNQKGYTASSDNHTVYIIAVDRSGYITSVLQDIFWNAKTGFSEPKPG